MNRQHFKSIARENIRINYLPWLIVAIISIFISYQQTSNDFGHQVHFRWLHILELVFSVGLARVAIDLSLHTFEDIKSSLFWNRQWLKETCAIFLINLYAALWGILLIIPGIMKSYAYSFVPYILAEDKEISISDAIAVSQDLTEGYKWELFVLDLSFILWDILAAFTFGLAAFYSEPYKKATWAQYYLNLSR